MATAMEEVQMTDLCSQAIPKAAFDIQERKTGYNDEVTLSAEEGKSRKIKKPRRILHFSDGTLEEYSTDDEAEEEKHLLDPMALVDPKSLTWGPWIYYWMLYSGSSALAVCDYVGESLANFLGITSPKYQYEIEEYNRSLEEEKTRKEEEDAEMAGWRSPSSVKESQDGGAPISAVEQPVPTSHGMREQDFQLLYKTGSDVVENSAEDASVGADASVPSVIVTSETADPSQEMTGTPGNQDSTNWERF